MINIGKMRGLSRLADESGHFTMVALDQRPPLVQAIAKARGIEQSEVSFADMIAAKRLLVRALASEASSMLFDPNYAIPAGIDLLPSRTGLIVTLEEHRFEDTRGGRKSRSIDNWSVDKIRRMGGDAVKVLLWYRPDASSDILARQKDYIRSVGADCRRNDIAFVLELLVYPFPDSASHTTDYVESADKRADFVIESVREFAKPEYGVDLYKLETPLPAAGLPERDGSEASLAAAAQFEELGAVCAAAGIPWVMLSGGAETHQFERVLSYSYAAGAQGFLAGRTIWLNAVQSSFPNEEAVLDSLQHNGLDILQRLKALTHAEAKPWTAMYSFDGIDREGAFCCAYV